MPAPTVDKRLPVTLLSGFLGSGKTTLLSNILKSKDHKLRCAVIVNDMGALNIDAALVKSHKLTRRDEKVVQMQNGCICCTLRADLLEEIANLVEIGEFDYLLIESSGISEPIQVAETFTQEFAETLSGSTIEEIMESLPDDNDNDSSSRDKKTTSEESKKRLAQLIYNGGLNKIAKLDTCVSVVDCTTFLGDFDTTDFLTDRLGKDVDPEDERSISDLLADQIEFANIIILNKIDLVSPETIESAEKVIKTLNPDAKIIKTSYSKVNLKDILNTGRFDFAKAAIGAGWLQSIRDMQEYTDKDGVVKMVPKPETEEYGVGSFVYSARRPFHPQRLWDLMCKPFCILQSPDGEDEDEDEEEDNDGYEDEDEEMKGDEQQEEEEETDIIMTKTKAEESSETYARLQAEKEALDLPSKAAFKRSSTIWKGLLRSKGFCWLATRPNISGEWSQAGLMFTLEGGSPWMCCVDSKDWPTDDPEVVEAIESDFMGVWGDRRQELVFIGQGLNQNLLTETLDEVLLNDKEWAQWQRVMNLRRNDDHKHQRLAEIFDDGWEAWNEYVQDENEEEGHEGHAHSRSSRR